MDYLCDDIFSVQDDMVNEHGLEAREGQNHLMMDIIGSLDTQESLICEAGVGIGKSLAYLIPGILYSKYTGEPLIVATSSIQLTEQLQDDIKLSKKLLGSCLPNSSIDVVVGKGRDNYPCLSKINKMISKEKNKTEREKLKFYREKIQLGADRQNKMGIPFEYWDKITDHICEDKSEIEKSLCPLHQMRNSLRNSGKNLHKVRDYNHDIEVYKPKVIIVNQNLLIAHFLKLESSGYNILPLNYSLLVIDEVHNLEKVTRDSIQKSIDKRNIEGLFSLIEGVYSSSQDNKLFESIHKVKSKLFDFLEHISNDIAKSYKNEIEEVIDYIPLNTFEIDDDIDRLVSEIQINIETKNITNDEFDSKYERFIKESLLMLLNFIDGFYNDSNYIIWAKYNKAKNRVIYFICPNSISQKLREWLFSKLPLTICLSATITNYIGIERKYDYIEEMIGFSGEESEIKDSPFNYCNSRLFIPDSLPKYNDRDEAYYSKIARYIAQLSDEIQGGSLVLFTSKEDLIQVNDNLNSLTEKEIFTGDNSSKTKEILKQFKNSKGIILGTGSFWEGIDLKGDLLTNLIIVRLPFPVPDAIIDYKENTLPEEINIHESEMVIRLRQGSGRLIRSYDDVGVLTLLDSRMNDKSYSHRELVLNCLPFKEHLHDFEEVKLFQRENNL
ncbi:ATP-dependent DNA helicase [Aerococcus sp. Group 1]|uniref:ATP-dependent DNA helicase n=1 Tax=Aerococcus urinae (strain CCUG 59500 / ACS-120-V-Col10a) TaxID=2976812 RepID=UPI00227B407D|nr:ATP-dependent DNA helicase [Aerococcus sp. Group 1]MCY3054721.1 ATP-dependent DNA helicase [Aerococcus sp. Group 1]